jgi:tetratricopeptide (TPR) repeat protein
MNDTQSFKYDVAISFAGEDRDVAESVVKALKARTISVFYDADETAELWGTNLVDGLTRLYHKEARFALMLVSRHYAQKTWTKLERKAIQARAFMQDDPYLLPLKIDYTELEGILPTDGYVEWKNNPEYIADLIQKKLGKTVAAKDEAQKKTEMVVDISSLPETDAGLFGRNRELEMLDQAWNNPDMNIVALVAWGGVGKTALVNQWLNLMQRDKYRGAQRVYGMSFYSQGAAEGKQASADRFFADALHLFRDPHPDQGDPVDKAKRLAALIRQQKTLLILDGLEPLQYPPGAEEGRLKDQGLKVLLKDLAANEHPGLCVISTRLWTADLKTYEGGSVQRLDLTHLAPADGASLLRSLSVNGTDKELQQASADFDGHALALTLLGTYLHAVFDGDVRQRDKIPQLIYDEERQGKHARRVMESYEKWLAATETGLRQLNILRIMGLFDRPATKGAIDALLNSSSIKGLTDVFSIQKSFSEKIGFKKSKKIAASSTEWQFAVQLLRDLRLLAKKDENRPDELDCHPLIREYFGEKLRKDNPDVWQEAHRRLYEYYKNLPKKQLPDTLEEMEPLFAAVAHGCQAGQHQEALDEVYWERICRKDEAFVNKQLGAFGADLAAIANFFEVLWTQPADGLTDRDKTIVLSYAGFTLRAVGRLREAAQPMQASLEALIAQKDWKQAAGQAGNLSELWLTIGDLPQAVEYAQQSVAFADRSGDGFQREGKRGTLADALHQSGKRAEAERLFQEAESLQKERQPEYDYLYSQRGFRYCDLLLSQGQYRAVMERAEKALEISKRNNWLLTIALDNLSSGRASLLQVVEQGTDDFTQAAAYLHQAVEGLRKAGSQEHLLLGLLARAALYRIKQDFPNAWADLDEVFEIADRSGMKLHLTDYHLEAGRLCLAEGNKDAAKKHLDAARALIQETGYHRRDADVQEIGNLV